MSPVGMEVSGLSCRLQIGRFGDSARQILVVALPAGLASLIQPLTQGVITGILAAYGVHAVAAFGITTRIEAMAFVVVMALFLFAVDSSLAWIVKLISGRGVS